MEWIVNLFKTLIEGFNAIVDMLILVHNTIVDATNSLQVQNFGIVDNTTVIFKSVSAFRYVVGDFIFSITMSIILFGISYAVYNFCVDLKKLIWGDKGAIEKTGSGIFSWISKFFKK